MCLLVARARMNTRNILYPPHYSQLKDSTILDNIPHEFKGFIAAVLIRELRKKEKHCEVKQG